MAKDLGGQKDKWIVSGDVVRWALLAIAVSLIAWGAIQGDVVAVLRKAALICYECIGIG